MASQTSLIDPGQADERYRRRYETLKDVFERRLASLTHCLSHLSTRLADDRILHELRENPTSAAYATAYADEMVQLEMRHEREAFIEGLANAVAEAEDQAQYYRDTLQKQQVDNAALRERLHLAVQEALAMRAKAEKATDLQGRRRDDAQQIAMLGRQLLEERQRRMELESSAQRSGAAIQEKLRCSTDSNGQLTTRVVQLEEKLRDEERERATLHRSLEEAQMAVARFEEFAVGDQAGARFEASVPGRSIEDRLRICKAMIQEKLTGEAKRANAAEKATADAEGRVREVSGRLEDSERRNRELERQISDAEAALAQKSAQVLGLQQAADAGNEAATQLRETLAAKEKALRESNDQWRRDLEDAKQAASEEEKSRAEKQLAEARAEDADLYNDLAKQLQDERGEAAARIAELEKELAAIYGANPSLRREDEGAVVPSLLTDAEASLKASEAVHAATERLSSKHELEKHQLRSSLEAEYQRDMFTRLQEDNSHVLDVREQLKTYVAKYNRAEDELNRERSRADEYEEKYDHIAQRVNTLNDHLEEANENIAKLSALVQHTERKRAEAEKALELERIARDDTEGHLEDARQRLSAAESELRDVRDRLSEALESKRILEERVRILEEMEAVDVPTSRGQLRAALRHVLKYARSDVKGNLETLKRDVEAVAHTHVADSRSATNGLAEARADRRDAREPSPTANGERVVQTLMKIFTAHHESAREAGNRTGWRPSELCEELRSIHQEAADYAACLARTQQRHDEFGRMNQQLIDCVQSALRSFDDDEAEADRLGNGAGRYRKVLEDLTSSLTSILHLDATEADELRSLRGSTDGESDLSGVIFPDTPSRSTLGQVFGVYSLSGNAAHFESSPRRASGSPNSGLQPSETIAPIITRAVDRLKTEAVASAEAPLKKRLESLEENLSKERQRVEARDQEVAMLREELDVLRIKTFDGERISEAESGVTQEVDRRQPGELNESQRLPAASDQARFAFSGSRLGDVDVVLGGKHVQVDCEIDFLRSQLQERERHLIAAVEEEREAVAEEYGVQLEQARQEIEHLRHRVARIEEIGNNALKNEREIKRAELDAAEKKYEDLQMEYKLLQEQYSQLQTELERLKRSHRHQAAAKGYNARDAVEYSRSESSFGDPVPMTSFVRKSDDRRVQKLLKSIDDSLISSAS